MKIKVTWDESAHLINVQPPNNKLNIGHRNGVLVTDLGSWEYKELMEFRNASKIAAAKAKLMKAHNGYENVQKFIEFLLILMFVSVIGANGYVISKAGQGADLIVLIAAAAIIYRIAREMRKRKSINTKAKLLNSKPVELLDREPTPREITSATLYYRHNFGLLPRSEQTTLKNEARQWLYAWRKVNEDSVPT